MADKIGIAANSYWDEWRGCPFDPRGVAQTMRTIDLTNRKPAASAIRRMIVDRYGKDSDGAYRAFNRLDGKA